MKKHHSPNKQFNFRHKTAKEAGISYLRAMQEDEIFMLRAIELAHQGLGHTASNPLVGCVIVNDGKIISEAYHHEFGGAHAEVLAIQRIQDDSLLASSTLYVNLEPCTHFGKTPPCADLIIAKKIKKVVIGSLDPNPLVGGKGIEKLKASGAEVQSGVLQKQADFLNRRFFTFHQKKRPYIILKWAQTADGFIDKKRRIDHPHQNSISSSDSKLLVHKWRTEEMAILVGKNTVLQDNPKLTARLVYGKSPVRIVYDKHLELPETAFVFNSDAETIVLNSKKEARQDNLIYKKINFEDSIQSLCECLYSENILSVIIEGGADTLQRFINENTWDEARVFTSTDYFLEGIKAPEFTSVPGQTVQSGTDRLTYHYNH